ncbi:MULTISPECIES: ABC transporter substrate-binding protein [unclassified Chelatococcus]|uniref:ABC transporter substrate-binding protein n=1 Tax=unclassified Chelatococcus TaxID=2638111 RepID=UPI001BCF4ED6|nr:MULTISPECIES: ABC transporter substrate-binding protein [unclassified Chelatococcus]CAH1654688.1 Peptide/nickel transport system substrate-binding protein [Hyphomicrobiales bacterium]MBS7740284.1 ABC transporter substrate-binding protein [Chelatococcus sp. HY11]MBX3544886.1 ABC transporter substrate-binding protein [Chelatococcus sp.]MCO5078475.1 ABC transporter substrate-binding protein [Chelatococcus sp.]CAH1685344.1 Peptide/nickel transport system substrate-binding protein [Hyphomicrobia
MKLRGTLILLATTAVLSLAQPVMAETLKFAGTTAALTFDPHSTNDFVTTSIVRQVYESLVELDADMNPIPGLAAKWEPVGESTWRLTLRPNVKFHDGSVMTAEDVAFSVKRQASAALYKTLFGNITDAKVVDGSTVDIISKGADPILPVKLTRLFVMSQKWATDNGVATVPALGTQGTEAFSLRHANGTGPMLLAEQIPGQKTVFKKNDAWWGTFKGNLTDAVYTAINSAPTRVAALLSGEVDMITDLPLQDIPRVEQTPKMSVVDGPQRLFMELEMDGTRDLALATTDKSGQPLKANPFKDVRVRRAIAHGINAQLIVDRIMRGKAKVIGIGSAPGFSGYQADLDQHWKYDVDLSKKLLAEAGYPDGFTTTLNCPLERYVNTDEICKAVSSMLARVGIDVKVNGMVWPEFAKMLTNGPNSSFHLIGAAGNSGDVQDTFVAVMATRDKSRGQQNWAMWTNPQFDAVTDELVKTLDPKRRNELYREGLKIARDNVHAVYLHQPFLTWAMTAAVKIPVRADSTVMLQNVEIKR